MSEKARLALTRGLADLVELTESERTISALLFVSTVELDPKS